MLQFRRFVFSRVSYQEYTQKHKNQLKPSRNKYAIFIKLLHYYISKLSNSRTHLLALFQNISKSCTFLLKFLNILPFLNIFFFVFFGKSHAVPYFVEQSLGKLSKVLVCLFFYFESSQVILLQKVSKSIRKTRNLIFCFLN